METPTEKHFELNKNKIARSLKEWLALDIRTPEGEKYTHCELYVPPHHVRLADDEEDQTATALVHYSVHYTEEKKHSVRIKFKYDDAGKFLRNTMVYV